MEEKLLGQIYENSTKIDTRKARGQYYSPRFIVDYILEKTLAKIDLVENPFLSLIDISCGAGYFLDAAYELLKEKFLANLQDLREKYGEDYYWIKGKEEYRLKGREYWQEENIHYHLLKHCIFGADKDPLAINLSKLALLSKSKGQMDIDPNIVECDSLVRWEEDGKSENKLLREFWSKKYDFSIGNPPYIGHKQLEAGYKNYLLKEYDQVFKNKSDISFCFIQRIYEILKDNGIASIITSRYFMESPTGSSLRSFLGYNTDILEIVDFYGGEVFKDIKIATGIYSFRKSKDDKNEISIHRLKDHKHKFHKTDDLKNKIESRLFSSFNIRQDRLEAERWLLISEEDFKIYRKLEDGIKYRLGHIGDCFQGIITGCDKAFILDKQALKEHKIEEELLKSWIKNSHIQRYELMPREQYIIYSNLIRDEKDYPKAISYIEKHKDRLMLRRETASGIRKWYQLQWGRKEAIFDQPKIIFPYKGRSNRFALDYASHYSSADTYLLTIKEGFKTHISLEYLLGLLNSTIYEYYFKLIGKQMGGGIYDYYPNSLLDLKIITDSVIGDIEERSKDILSLIKDKSDGSRKKINLLEEEINKIIGDYIGLSQEEYSLIKERIPFN